LVYDGLRLTESVSPVRGQEAVVLSGNCRG
jgi:hypothetical protein